MASAFTYEVQDTGTGRELIRNKKRNPRRVGRDHDASFPRARREVLRAGKAPVGDRPMKTCSTVQAALGWEGALAPRRQGRRCFCPRSRQRSSLGQILWKYFGDITGRERDTARESLASLGRLYVNWPVVGLGKHPRGSSRDCGPSDGDAPGQSSRRLDGRYDAVEGARNGVTFTKNGWG